MIPHSGFKPDEGFFVFKPVLFLQLRGIVPLNLRPWNKKDDLLKEVISHAKEYGFVFPSSEIYDGLSATYDYGQLGSELKNNIKSYWWKSIGPNA